MENIILENKEEIVKELKVKFPISKSIFFIVRINEDNEYDFFENVVSICPSVTQVNFTDKLGYALKFYKKNDIKSYFHLLEDQDDEDSTDRYYIMKFDGCDIYNVSPYTLRERIANFLWKLSQ